MLSFSQELHTLIAAPYPYLYVVTFEEARVLGLVRELASAMGKTLNVWRPEQHDDPAAAFDAELERLDSGSPGEVCVFVDAHPWLDEPGRVRALRVLESKLADSGTTAVFISPLQVIPPELAKDWAVIDAPLPEQAELQRLAAGLLPDDQYASPPHDRMANAALGLTSREAFRAFERARHLYTLESARGVKFDWERAVVEEKRRLLAAGSVLEFFPLDIGLDDVGGLEQLKSWAAERRDAFSARARQFGLPQPKGLLLLGVQGCGKSRIARALAGYWGLPLLRLDLSSLFSGSMAPDDALRSALRTAEAMAPSVLWVDELEKGFDDADGETTRLLGSLLTWLQEKRDPVFFVATANNVENLPPELMRRGRFDEIFFVDLPDAAARSEILSIHLQLRGRDASKFDLDVLAKMSEHYSGAELEQIVVSALYRAFAEERELEQADLTVAARLTVPLYAMYEAQIKALRSWAHGRARHAARDRKLTDLFGSDKRG